MTGWPLRVAADGDGAWQALLVAIADGRTIAGLGDNPTADPGRRAQARSALVCRPAPAMIDLVGGGPHAVRALPERPLGADQSNTSVVVGERVLLKAYRRLEPGLNPELELVAFLTEEARYRGVPPLAGYAEVVSASGEIATVAIAQAFVADGIDAYESIAQTLTAWLLGGPPIDLEVATDVAAELGALTAGLHAALGDSRGIPEFEPREATRAELRGWARSAQRQLIRAVDVTRGEAGRVLHDLAAAIAAELTVFEALPAAPILTRVHGDYHLGQVLITGDGYRVIDFEGEPTRPLEDRRAHGSPLRDVACMLRSLDHVGRSAGRRALARHDGPIGGPGLDMNEWLRRSRQRFLDAYQAGLRAAGSPIVVDPALLRAFEIEKETYEFIYASTYLPSWLWAPTEGMRGLFERTV